MKGMKRKKVNTTSKKEEAALRKSVQDSAWKGRISKFIVRAVIFPLPNSNVSAFANFSFAG